MKLKWCFYKHSPKFWKWSWRKKCDCISTWIEQQHNNTENWKICRRNWCQRNNWWSFWKPEKCCLFRDKKEKNICPVRIYLPPSNLLTKQIHKSSFQNLDAPPIKIKTANLFWVPILPKSALPFIVLGWIK